MGSNGDTFPWHLGVYDAHCHPTDVMSSLETIPRMKARALVVMATRAQDQDLVAEAAHCLRDATSLNLDSQDSICRVIPSFGWHPWFSHQIYDDLITHEVPPSKANHYHETIGLEQHDVSFIDSLPEPRPLSAYIASTRAYLERYPLALVGEIGLDRSFRIPDSRDPSQRVEVDELLTPGTREGRRLSHYRVNMEHQRKILIAQLKLAGEKHRAVSVHGVAAHGMLFDVLRGIWRTCEREVVGRKARKRREDMNSVEGHDEDAPIAHQVSPSPVCYPPRICLHSYSGPVDTLKQYLHPSVPAIIFFSFSRVINFSTPAASRTIEVIKAIPPDRILIESDLHCAGERMDNLLEEMARDLCQIKNWAITEGVSQLGRNWRHFVLGTVPQGLAVPMSDV